MSYSSQNSMIAIEKQIKETDQETITYNQECIFKNPKNILSPLIFLNAQISDQNEGLINSVILVFENLLALVNFTYYQQEYHLEGILKEILDKKIKMDFYGPKQVSKPKFKRTSLKKNRKINKKNKEKKKVNSLYPLEMLLSPLKKDYEFEKWTLKQLAVFECCLCMFGKRFDIISRFVS